MAYPPDTAGQPLIPLCMRIGIVDANDELQAVHELSSLVEAVKLFESLRDRSFVCCAGRQEGHYRLLRVFRPAGP